MSSIITGTTYNSDGTTRIPGATVRIYNRNTGALIGSTTSDSLADFSYTVSDDFDPAQFLAIAYNSTCGAGVADLKRYYYIVNYTIYDNFADSGVDLITFDPPSLNVRIAKVTVTSPTDATSTGSISIRNASGGGGSGINVSLTSGSRLWSNTGSLTTAAYFYVRCVDFVGGITNTNIEILYEYPDVNL
jgi:hypothetical protein